MNHKRFETPVNRLGFVLFCVSMFLCIVAFSITYRTLYSPDLRWLAHLVLDSSSEWQQTVFKLGLIGGFIGAALAWNYLSVVKRICRWVMKTEKPQ